MNHNQQSCEGRHDDAAALSEFLSSLMEYSPTIPDELVEHYLARSGFQCLDVRLTRLVAVATQKFVAEVAGSALQSKTSNNSKRQKGQAAAFNLVLSTHAHCIYLILKFCYNRISA